MAKQKLQFPICSTCNNRHYRKPDMPCQFIGNDIVEEVVVIEPDSYLARKGKTYEFLKSKPEDWAPAKIIGYLTDKNGQDQPVYEKLLDYLHVNTPYIPSLISPKVCQLCGHYIENEHTLKNIKDKQFMIVGSDCIHQHYGKVVRQQIKIFKDNDIRQEFNTLYPNFMEFLSTKKEQGKFANYNRLEYWAWQLRTKYQKIIVNKSSSRLLSNRIIEMKKYLEDK